MRSVLTKSRKKAKKGQKSLVYDPAFANQVMRRSPGFFQALYEHYTTECCDVVATNNGEPGGLHQDAGPCFLAKGSPHAGGSSCRDPDAETVSVSWAGLAMFGKRSSIGELNWSYCHRLDDGSRH